MKRIHLPGFLTYAAMIMWLLQVMISPAGAEEKEYIGAPISDFTAQIGETLEAHGAPAGAKIALAAPAAIITLTPGGAPQFDKVAYNAASGRFVMHAEGAEGTPPIVISGRAVAPVSLPVLTRDVARGETVTDADLDWKQTTDLDARLYLADADDIIGKTARRPLSKDAPLRALDLIAPILIRKGALVTVALEAPGLRLTQMGVAQQQGAAGELIRIKNVNSGREINAVVAGANLARAPFRTSAQAMAALTTN